MAQKRPRLLLYLPIAFPVQVTYSKGSIATAGEVFSLPAICKRLVPTPKGSKHECRTFLGVGPCSAMGISAHMHSPRLPSD